MRVTEQSPFRGSEAQRLADQAPATSAKSAPRRLPAAPRERKPALAALAVLLILGGAMITVTLVLRSGDRVSAIEIGRKVGAGQAMTLDMLREVQIADDGVRHIRWEDRQRVADYYAAVDLVPGTLLNPEMLVEKSTELRPGRAVLGLSLKPGQIPPGLETGNRVQVIYVPGDDSGKPQVLAANARVNWVSDVDVAGGGDTRSVEVIVDTDISPVVAAYASSQQIALAYLPGVTGSDGAGGNSGDNSGATGESSVRPTPQATAKRRATSTPTSPPTSTPRSTERSAATSAPKTATTNPPARQTENRANTRPSDESSPENIIEGS